MQRGDELIQPVLGSQAGHLPEVARVSTQQRGIVGKGDARDLQIHRADAHALAAEIEKQFGRFGIPREDRPISEDFDLPLEFGVGRDLAMRVEMAIYFCEPAAHLLFHCDHGD